ncbi:hypothetical protein AAFN90_03080 [Erwiniaceae bacterium CAU 1747]
MDEIELEFYKLSVQKEFFSEFGVDANTTSWDTKSTVLASFFSSFFKGFNTDYEMTIFLFEDFGEFFPMLLGRAEIPYAIADFDQLTDDDLLFWKR